QAASTPTWPRGPTSRTRSSTSRAAGAASDGVGRRSLLARSCLATLPRPMVSVRLPKRVLGAERLLARAVVVGIVGGTEEGGLGAQAQPQQRAQGLHSVPPG